MALTQKTRDRLMVALADPTAGDELADAVDAATLELGGDLSASTLTLTGALVGTTLDVNGTADAVILDADADTTISADTDDQINIEIGGVDHVVLKKVATADAAATTSIQEIAFTAPVDTTGTNVHNGLNIDIEVSNSTGGTNSVNGISIDAITADAQVTATAILVGTGWDIGLDLSGTKLELDADNDTSIVASTDDTIVIEVGGGTVVTLTATAMTFEATCFPVLPITDTDGTVEGSLWYDASEDKLKFKTGAGVETVTSS